jgi:membrane carboxypeptidase/penicillin-binding protein
VITPQTCYLITNWVQGVIRKDRAEGRAWAAGAEDRDDQRHARAWFIGYLPQLVAGRGGL